MYFRLAPCLRRFPTVAGVVLRNCLFDFRISRLIWSRIVKVSTFLYQCQIKSTPLRLIDYEEVLLNKTIQLFSMLLKKVVKIELSGRRKDNNFLDSIF